MSTLEERKTELNTRLETVKAKLEESNLAMLKAQSEYDLILKSHNEILDEQKEIKDELEFIKKMDEYNRVLYPGGEMNK